MARVITFGEIMMRLNPEGYLRFVQADKFEATYAGGEANVAVSLANYGMDAAYVTKVPAHEIGQCAVNELRRYGVDTSLMLRGGPRLGVYYCEKGASQRASKVIYDRAGSSIALAKADEFDWDKIFDGADWFHWTGITPALGGDMPEACLEACKAAQAKGSTVSCDLTDCYAATGRGPGFSFNQQAFYVRIDNILCSNHFTPYNCKVDNKIKASDHYPIFCWLKKR